MFPISTPAASLHPLQTAALQSRPARSKNTIDTVYAKLQKAEAEGEAGVHGASTGEVMESVLQVGWWGLLAGCGGGPAHQGLWGTLRRWVVDSKV